MRYNRYPPVHQQRLKSKSRQTTLHRIFISTPRKTLLNSKPVSPAEAYKFRLRQVDILYQSGQFNKHSSSNSRGIMNGGGTNILTKINYWIERHNHPLNRLIFGCNCCSISSGNFGSKQGHMTPGISAVEGKSHCQARRDGRAASRIFTM